MILNRNEIQNTARVIQKFPGLGFWLFDIRESCQPTVMSINLQDLQIDFEIANEALLSQSIDHTTTDGVYQGQSNPFLDFNFYRTIVADDQTIETSFVLAQNYIGFGHVVPFGWLARHKFERSKRRHCQFWWDGVNALGKTVFDLLSVNTRLIKYFERVRLRIHHVVEPGKGKTKANYFPWLLETHVTIYQPPTHGFAKMLASYVRQSKLASTEEPQVDSS